MYGAHQVIYSFILPISILNIPQNLYNRSSISQNKVYQVTLMEDPTTKEVVRLEIRYGEITGISRDAGSNLLEQNLNPMLAEVDRGKMEQRLFGTI